MEFNEKQNKYADILTIIDEMKQEVVNTSMQQLMVTGTMPESSQKELKVLSQITGAVFNGMITLGTEVYEDTQNNGLVYTTIGGKRYSCAKINISNSVSISEKPLSASEAYSLATNAEESKVPSEPAKKVTIEEFEETKVEFAPIVEPIPTNDTTSIAESILGPVESVVSEPVMEETTPVETPVQEVEEPTYYTNLDESAEFGEEVEVQEEEVIPTPVEEVVSEPTPEPVVAPTPVATPVYDDDLADDDDFMEAPMVAPVETATPVAPVTPTASVDDDLLDDDDFNLDAPVVQEKEEEKEEEIIEDDDEDIYETPVSAPEPTPVVETPAVETSVPNVSVSRRGDNWEEEQMKSQSSMIYNMSKLTLAHIDGGKPEEIIAMIAPLKVSRVASPAVPIIVTLWNRGKVVYKTSYDMGDGGKTIVTIDINEFYFLCRGSFDENGNFKAFITTTGQSSQQGDRLTVVSSKNYGNSLNPDTNNGHIKMRYNSMSGPGTIEVFPFGTEKDGEFIVFVKNTEFNDIYYISQRGRTGSSVIIFGQDENGLETKLEIVPTWNGDILEVEVFEK